MKITNIILTSAALVAMAVPRPLRNRRRPTIR